MSTPQTEIPKKAGGARGAYFEGLIATVLDEPDGRPMFAIFAGDIETLRDTWERLSPDPLDEELVQKVAMFSQSAVTEVHPS